MEFELRELKGSDIFKAANILGKLDIKDDLILLFKGGGSEETAEGRGMEIIAGLAQNLMVKLPDVEKDLNTFLAELAGMKVKEVQDLSLTDYMTLLTAFGKKQELLDFFQSLTSFLK